MTFNEAVELARMELTRAEAKFPAGFHSGHEGYAVIHEELDELWEAVKRDDTGAQGFEAVQVAAMALRFLVMLCEFEDVAAYTRGRIGPPDTVGQMLLTMLGVARQQVPDRVELAQTPVDDGVDEDERAEDFKCAER